MSPLGFLILREDDVAVFDNELNSEVLGVHVGHLAFYRPIPHNGGREDNCQVLGRHLFLVNECPNIIDRMLLTRFSRSRLATRARWNMRNSRQSLCFCGKALNVFRRWSYFSSSVVKAMRQVSNGSEIERINGAGWDSAYSLSLGRDRRPRMLTEE